MTGLRISLRQVALALVGATLLAACGAEAPAPAESSNGPAAGGLDLAKLQTYRALVLPKDSERAWEQVEWQTSYEAGLRASSAAQKPLLLWVMNGHPLGCT
jgi:hypothetical protein